MQCAIFIHKLAFKHNNRLLHTYMPLGPLGRGRQSRHIRGLTRERAFEHVARSKENVVHFLLLRERGQLVGRRFTIRGGCRLRRRQRYT